MITPPLGTPSFYTAILEHQAARFMVGLLSATGGRDIQQVMITSTNMPSDLHATNELSAGSDIIIDSLSDDVAPAPVLHFNPLYLPAAKNLSESLEYDDQGDIYAVDGFNNPYILVSLKHGTVEEPELIDGRVNWQSFQLPSMIELLDQKEARVS